MMKINQLTMSCMVLCAAMLSGCIPAPTKVKDVLADKTGYLAANFSPGTLKPAVREKIQANDATPLKFHKMKVDLTWTFNKDDKNKTSVVQKSTTYLNAGGNLVQELSDYSKNGIVFKQRYDLTYRGVLSLKTQSTNDSSTFASTPYEVKELETFDSLDRAREAQELAYKFKFGTKVQIMNFLDGSETCTVGKSHPASQESASLSGSAEPVLCTNYNDNGVAQGESGFVYLSDYGVAILTSTKAASGISDAKIDSVKID